MEFCFSCMSKKNGSGACLKCGYSGNYDCPAHHLEPGSILNGKYMIGNAIGEGGFGITYVGIDLNLERKVAIKEYFPSGIVTRNGTETITVFTGDSQQYFMEGREKFINEAKALARLNNLPGIVAVIDFFMENGTSYIVMEFIEGKPMKSMLKERIRMDSEDVFNMLKPLIQSLCEVHKLGIIHRDISPDNIMITNDSNIKLIDFGAARDVSQNKSLSIQLKPGYAPEEQYRTHGKQGPWTDVYAVCATIYRAITGILPPEALERIREDTLQAPSQMGIVINPHKEEVLMRGLSLYYEGRIKSMEELYNGLYYNAPIAPPIPPQTTMPQYNYNVNTGEKSGGNPIMITVIIALTVIMVALFVMLFIFGSAKNSKKNSSTPAPAPTAVQTSAPTEEPRYIYRVSSFNPNLTYKRMDEIKYSVESSDDRLLVMDDFIKDYVTACDDYMNDGSNTVFQYLVSGTTAYSQQTGYKEKHPTLTQRCLNSSVQDVREYNGYYYVWDTEELSETENGATKTTTNHWVYKIKANGNSYQVVDYTYDPAYKQ